MAVAAAAALLTALPGNAQPGRGGPGIAPAHSHAYGKSLPEWLSTYWRWYYTGADPAESTVGQVRLMPLPAGTQISGTGTPADPALYRGQLDITLLAGTPFVLPEFAWVWERYNNGTPDDVPMADAVALGGAHPVLTIDGRTVLSDANKAAYYVPDTAFNPIVVYPTPTSYGAIAALSFQGVGVVGEPLSVGKHVIHLYDRIKRGDTAGWTDRCVLIGGKAAPGYAMAKLIIKLVNNVAAVVNADPAVADRLKVAFLPNYSVSAMEVICPGTDLSEQLSTAGTEASGTGNMKIMMNGAITIGTLDGANIEIREEVGEDNFFVFGLTSEEVDELRWNYDPHAVISHDDDLQRVMNLLRCGHFNLFDAGLFDPIINAICSPHDPWMVAADFRSFVEAQKCVATAYQDRERWTRMSIMNTACSGKFSTDRTISNYNEDIWHLEAMPIGDSPLP